MSKILVDTIDTRSGTSNITIGSSNASQITLKSGATLTNFPANTPTFAVGLDASQSLNNSTTTKLTFTSELIDTDNAFADSKFTVPSGKAGKYFFHAKVRAANITTSLSLYIYKNGSEVNVNYRSTGYSAGGIPYGSAVLVAIVDCAEGDYIEIYGDQNSGSTNSLTTKLFQGYKLA
jgi:hypothetical protein